MRTCSSEWRPEKPGGTELGKVAIGGNLLFASGCSPWELLTWLHLLQLFRCNACCPTTIKVTHATKEAMPPRIRALL